MKFSHVLLAASLTFSAVLVALIAFNGAGESPTPLAYPGIQAGQRAAGAAKRSTSGSEAWTALQTDDLVAFRDRLTAEGFPPAIVRAIVVARIREGFAARTKAIESMVASTPYWRNPLPDLKLQAEQRALAKEEQQAVRDLLGPDPENGPAATLRRQLPDFAPATIDQLAAIRERYDDQRQQIYSTVRGSFSSEEGEQLSRLDKAMRAEFAAVLTPQELEAYDLRSSNTANQLRYTLRAMEVSEAEFRALYRLQSAFDERFGPNYGPSAPDQMRERQAAQKVLMEEIAAALGPARYADYQRGTDYEFQQTTALVARLELPAETANQIYAVQKEIQQRSREFQTNAALDAEQRRQELAALFAEAQTKLTPLLGPRGFEAYKQYGGNWLNNLAPRPAVPTPPTPAR